MFLDEICSHFSTRSSIGTRLTWAFSFPLSAFRCPMDDKTFLFLQILSVVISAVATEQFQLVMLPDWLPESELTPSCSCFSSFGLSRLNFTCVNNCFIKEYVYGNPNCSYVAYSDCNFVVSQYIGFGKHLVGLDSELPGGSIIVKQSSMVDIYRAPKVFVIALKAELDIKFSYEHNLKYSCNLTLATFKKETAFLKKCFHYIPEE